MDRADNQSLLEQDKQRTLRNHERLVSNRNLVAWYRKLFEHQFEGIDDFAKKTVLEIGSGTSPIKLFHPHVMTSDVMELDYIDHRFDCHKLASYPGIQDGSLDLITLTNVLHHLKDPIEFLCGAAVKLKPGGMVIATEPFFSVVSTPIYKLMHHEPVDFSIQKPMLDHAGAPLSCANMALPHLIFFLREDWTAPLQRLYAFHRSEIRYFTSLSYMLTGGISHRLPFPGLLYRAFLAIDVLTSHWFPKLTASFFTIKLRRL
jgi:hypothetical protein